MTKYRLVLLLSAVAVLLLTSGPAVEASTKSSGALCVLPGNKVKRYYAQCEQDGGARATFVDDEAPALGAEKKVARRSIQSAMAAAPAAAPMAVPVVANPLGPNACGDGWNFHLAIGESFNDLNFLNTKNCNAAQAKGAQFSWSRDRVAFNDQWSAKGAVAPELIWINPIPVPEGPYLNLWAVAPTITFNRVTNSNTALAAQNANVFTYGFSSEALFDRVGSWQVYARARANVNSDFSGITKSYSTTGELQALSDRFGVGRNFAIGNFGYFWFIPLVRAQYFERASRLVKDPIFDTRDQVLRAGPVVSLNFIPAPTEDADPNKPLPAPKWFLNVTYSWYKDFYSGRTFEHFNPSFTYNFTDNIGLTLGYDRGRIEQTGKKVDLTTVSLSVKN